MKANLHFTTLFIFCLIFMDLHANSCASGLFYDDFTYSTNWQTQGNGQIYIADSACRLENAYCGSYNRVYSVLNRSVSETYWKAECDFTILTENPDGNGTGCVVMALTAGTLDFMSYDITQNYEETYQDGIAVILMSDGSDDNDIDHWYFLIEGKKGIIRSFDLSSVIYANSAQSRYYLRLERLNIGTTQLSIFSDPGFTQHIPGSPVNFDIDPSICRLNTLQHGTITPGMYSRLINATFDNDLVCDDQVNVGTETFLSSFNSMNVFPNPGTTIIRLQTEKGEAIPAGTPYKIISVLGKEVSSKIMNMGNQVDISGLSQGLFFLIIQHSRRTFSIPFEKTFP